jgi:lysozyme
MHSFYLDAIRNFEGFTPKATWDYAQNTNGFGTKASYAGEVIDRAEAERRFKAEVLSARSIVEKAVPDVDEGTKAALTSLTYNAGTSWIGSGLGDAVRRGDLDAARDIFQEYNKAGGEVLPGLVNRRSQEALWIGNPDGLSSSVASASTAISDTTQSVASADALPPVVVDGDEGALKVAEMLRARVPREAAPKDATVAVAGTSDQASVFDRSPRTERIELRRVLSNVASNALASLVDAERLGPGGMAEVTRLAQLGRGSELAGTDRDRQEKETRRV